MTALRPFRFEVIAYDAQSKEEWVAKARRIEQLGYAAPAGEGQDGKIRYLQRLYPRIFPRR